MMRTHCTIDSPVGPLTLIAADGALVAIRFPGEPPAGVDDEPEDSTDPVLVAAAGQLGEYFAGSRLEFDLPLAPAGTPFQVAAWWGLATIPYGETISYGEQARRLGHDGKARAIGAANGRNPLPLVLPCHRVIGSDGALTGFGGGLPTKEFLLRMEGALPTAADLFAPA